MKFQMKLQQIFVRTMTDFLFSQIGEITNTVITGRTLYVRYAKHVVEVKILLITAVSSQSIVAIITYTCNILLCLYVNVLKPVR